jgi:hypothetical protein
MTCFPVSAARLIRHWRRLGFGLVLARHRSHPEDVEALSELALQSGGAGQGKDDGNGRPLLTSEGERELRLVGGHAYKAVTWVNEFAEIVVRHGGFSPDWY